MPSHLHSRNSWTDTIPGGLPGNGGTIAWAVGLSLFVLIGVPALVIWRRRRKVVKAQMAKTAEGAAAWRAHRARERQEAQSRFLWHRADRSADQEAAAWQAEQESVPTYEAQGTGDGRPPDYDDLELQPLPPAHVREYFGSEGPVGREAWGEHAPQTQATQSTQPPPSRPLPPASIHSARSQALQPGTAVTVTGSQDVSVRAESPQRVVTATGTSEQEPQQRQTAA